MRATRQVSPPKRAAAHHAESTGHERGHWPSSVQSRYPYPGGNSLLNPPTAHLSLLARPNKVLVQLLLVLSPAAERASQRLGHSRILADGLHVVGRQFRVTLPEILVAAAFLDPLNQVVDQQPSPLDHELPRLYQGVHDEPLQPRRGLVQRTDLDGDALPLGEPGLLLEFNGFAVNHTL